MRVLAIGDVHGCVVAWDTLWEYLDPQPEDLIITLGDYVDRGPDSRGILDRLLKVQRSHRLVPLLGNHEEMMLGARFDGYTEHMWRTYGGQQTLESYAPEGRAGSLLDVPVSHWEFLEHCLLCFEGEEHFFVHAGVESGLPLSNQPRSVLLWEKLVDPRPHRSGKIMVCGHTPQTNGEPLDLGFAVCIDTWAYGDGWLTGLDVLTGRYWQANEDGERRAGRL